MLKVKKKLKKNCFFHNYKKVLLLSNIGIICLVKLKINMFVYFIGAFGYFECTHDITQYCKAKPFEFVGKKTPLAVRFSTVGKKIINQNGKYNSD